MKRLLLSLSLILLLILKANGQCIGTRSGSTIADDFEVSISLDCMTEIIQLSVQYKAYADNYFGLVFHHTMITHKSLVFTTGKDEDRSAALYAYDMSSKRASGVIYEPTNDWTEVDTITESNYIHIKYEQAISNTEWTIDTESIGFRVAVGSTLKLEMHDFKTDHATVFLTSDVAADVPTTSKSPTTGQPTPAPVITPSPTNSGNGGCGGNEAWTASDSFGDMDVILTINCIHETVTIDITYNAFNGNWFGVVFGNDMFGDALIYTSGKSDDRDEALYYYSISGKMASDVVYNAQLNWREVSTTNGHDMRDNVIQVVYEQDLDKTSWDVDTHAIPMRWAYGPQSAALRLVQHEDRSDVTYYFDLTTGGSRKVEDDHTLQYAHGIIMWLAWSVFATIGIMGSAFRWLFAAKPQGCWFKIHRSAQIAVLVMHLIAFIMAVIFVEDEGAMHFHNNHMRLGLVVTVLVVLQPINAACRPHVPKAGEAKPLGRLVWELIHKSFGYSAWIIAAVTIYLGLKMDDIDEPTLAYVHLFGWCGLIVIVYIVLSIKKATRQKKEVHVASVNDNESDDALESDAFVNGTRSSA
eukprot:252729_1